MRRRFFILGICIFFITVILTGCSANINIVNNPEKEEKNENSSEENVQKALSETEGFDDDFYYSDSKYSSSYIDLGDKYYYIIYGLDDDQNVTWTYETKIQDVNTYTNYINSYDEELVFVIEDGTLIALDMDSGEVLWRLENENLVNNDYYVRDNGNIDIIYGEDTKKYISVDKEGNVVNRVNLAEYGPDLSDSYWFNYENESEIVITASDAEDYREKMKVKINVDTSEVSVEKYEYTDVTEDILVGKSISNGFYESYFFNSDGTVVISRDDYYEKFSVIRYTGTWKIEDGMLKIHANEAVVAYNGDYITNEDGTQVMVNYEEKSMPANFERESSIYYCPNYNGQEKIYLDGEFYSFLEAVG